MTALPVRGLYFYLSHAHSDASAVYFVQRFFKDLSDEVRTLAPGKSDMDIGFADLRPGGESAEAVEQALARAHVFVPLYSPGYADFPDRERERVRQHLVTSSAYPSQRRIQPVIWEPVPLSTDMPNLGDAWQLGADFPAYAEHGLFAMCRLSRYRTAYKEIVRRLAAQIVEAIDQPAVAPAELPPPERLPQPEAAPREFVVAVIALTDNRLPAQRSKNGDCYGSWPSKWQPFRNGRNEPIAKYTADLAARAFQLPTRTIDFVVDGRSLETSPGVILLDPWILARDDGPALLSAAMEMVGRAVTLMAVLDRSDPQYADGFALAKQVEARAHHQNYKLTMDRAEFHKEIRKVINRTRRRYLNNLPTAALDDSQPLDGSQPQPGEDR